MALISPTEKWDRRMLKMAHEVATWSKDPVEGVGCVLVAPNFRRVSWGYNGFPRGIADSPHLLEDQERKRELTVHAEANAILNAKTDLAGWSCFITKFPCNPCAGLLAQAGVRRLVFDQAVDPDSSWFFTQATAFETLSMSQVEIWFDRKKLRRCEEVRDFCL